MLLRPALAAVNAIGLHNNTQNITSRTFILPDAWASVALPAAARQRSRLRPKFASTAAPSIVYYKGVCQYA